MANLKNKSLKNSMLAEQAEKNATVTKGTKSERAVIKKGIPNDHSPKHLVGGTQVGIAVGTTMNMDNYESLRIDVWLTDTVSDSETVGQAYERVTKTVDDTLQKLVAQYTE